MARKVLTPLDMTGQRILNLGSPSLDGDAASKVYVDNLIAGLQWKPAVRAATTANVTLATGFENGDVIDGVTLATGNRILIKNQTAGAENGIYTVNASGAPTRSLDADSATELVPNATVLVSEGTVNADLAWTCITNGVITPGVTATVWALIGGGGSAPAAGGGLVLAANIYSVGAGTGIIVNADDIAVNFTTVTGKFAALIGTGAATSIPVTHNLGTRDVTVSVHDATTFEEIECDVVKTSTTVVTLGFAVAPGTNAYRCVVHG